MHWYYQFGWTVDTIICMEGLNHAITRHQNCIYNYSSLPCSPLVVAFGGRLQQSGRWIEKYSNKSGNPISKPNIGPVGVLLASKRARTVQRNFSLVRNFNYYILTLFSQGGRGAGRILHYPLQGFACTRVREEYSSLIHKWIRKQRCTDNTAKGRINVSQSQSHASMRRKVTITFQWMHWSCVSDQSEWLNPASQMPSDGPFQCDPRDPLEHQETSTTFLLFWRRTLIDATPIFHKIGLLKPSRPASFKRCLHVRRGT